MILEKGGDYVVGPPLQDIQTRYRVVSTRGTLGVVMLLLTSCLSRVGLAGLSGVKGQGCTSVSVA